MVGDRARLALARGAFFAALDPEGLPDAQLSLIYQICEGAGPVRSSALRPARLDRPGRRATSAAALTASPERRMSDLDETTAPNGRKATLVAGGPGR